jgi:serine/threonine protein kinase
MPTTSDLREWLVDRFHDYVVSDEPVKGTYGLIWFLKAKNSVPPFMAVKTLAPEALTNPKSSNDIDYLRREFRLWMALPQHNNVVTALGFDTARLSGDHEIDTVSLPVMRMPKLAGSLQDWVDDASIGIEDRLIALAQTFNGLQHLYKNGFEGHGDLKPSNILYLDLGDKFTLDDRSSWPSVKHPWVIRVADLGWADAWIDLGFTNKAFRQYLAPERLEDRFSPIQSDMFSMGIVAAELLQRSHPAQNLKRALGSDGKWKRCVESGNWNLGGINSDRLKQLISRCLDVDPACRPPPEECMSEICSELQERFGQDIAPTLQLWNEQSSPIADHEHFAQAAFRTINLGVQEATRSREGLEHRIKKITVLDFETCEIWLVLALPLIDLLEREEEPDSVLKISQLRKSAKIYLETVFGKMDKASMEAVATRDDWIKNEQAYQRFSQVICYAAEVAGVDYEAENSGSSMLGPYALSALAFSDASLAHGPYSMPNTEEYYVSEAIRHAPEEAVPYYFRALWRDMRLRRSSFQKTGKLSLPEGGELAAIFTDLEIAIRLSPNWDEPKKELQKLQKLQNKL